MWCRWYHTMQKNLNNCPRYKESFNHRLVVQQHLKLWGVRKDAPPQWNSCQFLCHLNGSPRLCFFIAAPDPAVLPNLPSSLQCGPKDLWVTLVALMTPSDPFIKLRKMAAGPRWPDNYIRMPPITAENLELGWCSANTISAAIRGDVEEMNSVM